MFRFADFDMDPQGRQLRRSGVPLSLRGTAFAVLQALVERPGETIDKRALCERAWPGRAVDDNNLQVEIGALRKLIGHGAIVTVAGRGYQFTWPVAITQPATEPATEPANHGLATERWHDLQAVDALLTPGSLVTLTGEAGSGKSHLARALMGGRLRSAGGAAGGDCCIDLAAPNAATALGAAIQGWGQARQRAGPRSEQQPPPAGALAPLCVLDGADRWLPETAGTIAAWRRNHPTGALLVTSRERLRLPGERLYRLRPLGPASAVALFEQLCGPAVAARPTPATRLAQPDGSSAQLAQPDGSSDQLVQPDGPCARLEGNPLALTLAADFARRHGEAALRALLDPADDRRLDLGGDAEAVDAGPASARSPGLRASMALSLATLSASERAAWRALAGLALPCTLAEATVAMAAFAPDTGEVIDLLGRLFDKSLLNVVEPAAGADTRYGMSTTARLFALEAGQPP
jgi:DNA-binding winged helix-turn-helix (wHTH) protein/energy-coupling factor transporter ATP-binding protein EcfA2